MTDFGYVETKDNLHSRIKANSKFGNFDLHEWIENKFDIKNGDKVLDLGCGDGSYTRMFQKKVKKNGLVFGVDKNLELLKTAKNRFRKKPENVSYKQLNYDEPWNIRHDFDWVFSIYSLQYTNNFPRIVANVKKVLNENGSFVVIGPAEKNSEILNDIHYCVTGKKAPKMYVKKMGRIENEFYEKLKISFKEKNIKKLIFNYKLCFPTSIDFAKYYWSTPLWRDAVKGLKINTINNQKIKTVKYLTSKRYKNLKKQIACVICS
jgi:ubiquinone/menaquinone biosynthesis C-methylase UbiE